MEPSSTQTGPAPGTAEGWAALQTFLTHNEALLGWLAVASGLMFVGSAVIIPWLLIRLPADYFAATKRHSWLRESRYPLLYLPLQLLKNLIGILLVLLGLLLFVLPGQGLLTIIIGIALVDFPQKYKLESALVRRKTVRQSINWLRKKYNRPPLQFPPR